MIELLCHPDDDSLSEHKKLQLRELAAINGTLRDEVVSERCSLGQPCSLQDTCYTRPTRHLLHHTYKTPATPDYKIPASGSVRSCQKLVFCSKQCASQELAVCVAVRCVILDKGSLLCLLPCVCRRAPSAATSHTEATSAPSRSRSFMYCLKTSRLRCGLKIHRRSLQTRHSVDMLSIHMADTHPSFPVSMLQVEEQYKRDIARVRGADAVASEDDYKTFLKELGGAPPPELMGEVSNIRRGLGTAGWGLRGRDLPDDCKVGMCDLQGIRLDLASIHSLSVEDSRRTSRRQTGKAGLRMPCDDQVRPSCLCVLQLYVGSLPSHFKDEDLRGLFESFGNVGLATVVLDQMTVSGGTCLS